MYLVSNMNMYEVTLSATATVVATINIEAKS